jgi:hypothetical protein
MTRKSFGVLASVLLVAVSSRAHAYCRTTTCDRIDAPPECFEGGGSCSSLGSPIAWPDTCVSTSVSAFGSEALGISADDLRSVVREAFEKWTSAPCTNGEVPRLVVDTFPDVRCVDVTGEAGYKEKGPNYNIWIFQDTDWPYESIGMDAIAITTTQFHPVTGEIYDSDVELNSRDNPFTLTQDQAEIDLPSVVLHEAGHFLGLAHATLASAVMSPTLQIGDTSKRILDPDDVQGVCAIYPPGPRNPSCDPEPRHGFSTECEARSASCAVSWGSVPQHGRSGVVFLAGLLAAAACRRRRSIGGSPPD